MSRTNGEDTRPKVEHESATIMMLQEQSAAIAAAASSAADMLKEEIEQKKYLASSNPVGRLLSEMECTDLIYPVCKQMGIFEVEELHAALLIAPANDPQHHQNNTTKLHKYMESAEINVRWQWRKLEDYLLNYNNRKHYIAAIIHHQDDFEQTEKAVRLRQLISNKQTLNQVLEARGLQRFQSYLQDIMHLTHSADLAHVVADDCQHWIANLQPEMTSVERDRLTHLLEDARKAKENLECIRQEYLSKNPAARFLDGIVKLPYLIEPLCKDLGVLLESELLNVDVEDFLAVGLSAIDLKGLQDTPALKVSRHQPQSSSTDSKNQARKPLQSIITPMTTGSSDGNSYNSTTSSGGAMMAAAGAPYQLDMNTFR
ncbi:hypothetical protein CEUSTIGMA_g7673.t1 [Chlamydomonas eustigma]|uniref:Uncharacterized protein n=1 Tax=Chlamydomonas eustigma TaxID=1157962 RepID=A0A250XAV9_9CHLO|nr:hypothetical protein CEUSTIGMA_g7673.t1 [Chlamydomonas eustigma]|eukprot:GAX80235.1 hypothetical protein CEUSTIGMA_g7673.t1 [Chlamydomonas eustigma]